MLTVNNDSNVHLRVERILTNIGTLRQYGTRSRERNTQTHWDMKDLGQSVPPLATLFTYPLLKGPETENPTRGAAAGLARP